MSILLQLLEYEDPTLQGIPLQKEQRVKYDPTKQQHLRYHKTKAGLYVVLEHNQGKIQMTKFLENSKISCSIYPRLNRQPEYFADHIRCEGLKWNYDPSAKESVCKSHTRHYSGLQFHHTVNSRDNSIFSVEISGWTKFEEESYELPVWRLQIQKNSPESYRSNAAPMAEGNIFSYQKHTLERDGRIVQAPLLILAKERLDYEASINHILEQLQLYSQEENKEYRKGIAQQLNSLDCLVFK